MNSVRRWLPDALRFVILVDEVADLFDPESESFQVILSKDLPISRSQWFHFKYTILELSTAVKPWALAHLFNQYDFDLIIYFDPDIKLYSSLDDIFQALWGNTMVLTPHLTGSLADQRSPSELDILRSGAYNLGFIALNRNAEALRFLAWWQAKLYDHCVVDLARGLFVDQRWIDLVPGMFTGVVINREPGYNVAYWNLPHRAIRRTVQGFVVNGQPLHFFHFSGFDPTNPEQFSKHQNRYRLSDLGDAADLVREYGGELLQAGYRECIRWPYAYGQFVNGHPILDMARPVHNECEELLTQIEDPFSNEGFETFVKVWNEPAAGRGVKPGVTRLAYRLYRSRLDVQAAMPDILGGDYVHFLEWLLSSGKSEHLLSDVFLAPSWDALNVARVKPSSPEDTQQHARSLAGNPLLFRLNSDVSNESPGALNELISAEDAAFPLTRLARAIYESRPDLQRYLPDPCGRDGPSFLLWILTYGIREYGLTDIYLDPLRKQWETLLGSLSSVQRYRYRILLAAATQMLAMRERAAEWKNRIRFAWVRRHAVAEAHNEDPADHAIHPPSSDAHTCTSIQGSKASPFPFGINLIGYLQAEMGVGESARAALIAAGAVNIPIAVKSVPADSRYREHHRLDAGTNDSLRYAFNIFHINADQTGAVVDRLGASCLRNRYNIGYWAWELEEFPERWLPSFAQYHEIWTPSSFCQDAISQRSPVPVIRIPHCITVDDEAPLGRADLGLPEEPFLFLCAFDMLSVFERKNPLAVIQAFRKAFDSERRVHLIIKINNAGVSPDNLSLLREASSDTRITIIDKTYSKHAMTSLLRHCNCLVSLHRSEGFGFIMAEAMRMRKPVIATAYSGNMDFTKLDNSFLVNYTMKAVGQGCAPYDEHCSWADPDITCAAAHMRTVFGHPETGQRAALSAEHYISQHFSPQVIGQRVRMRLEHVWTTILGQQINLGEAQPQFNIYPGSSDTPLPLADGHSFGQISCPHPRR